MNAHLAVICRPLTSKAVPEQEDGGDTKSGGKWLADLRNRQINGSAVSIPSILEYLEHRLQKHCVCAALASQRLLPE